MALYSSSFSMGKKKKKKLPYHKKLWKQFVSALRSYLVFSVKPEAMTESNNVNGQLGLCSSVHQPSGHQHHHHCSHHHRHNNHHQHLHHHYHHQQHSHNNHDRQVQGQGHQQILPLPLPQTQIRSIYVDDLYNHDQIDNTTRRIAIKPLAAAVAPTVETRNATVVDDVEDEVFGDAESKTNDDDDYYDDDDDDDDINNITDHDEPSNKAAGTSPDRPPIILQGVDARAEEFINNFYQHLRIQRAQSMEEWKLEFHQMLARSA